jgi:hypothetical protein
MKAMTEAEYQESRKRMEEAFEEDERERIKQEKLTLTAVTPIVKKFIEAVKKI